MILATSSSHSSVTVERHGKCGGGESGELCCELKEAGKVERIFSIFFCKKFNKSITQKLRRIYEWEQIVW